MHEPDSAATEGRPVSGVVQAPDRSERESTADTAVPVAAPRATPATKGRALGRAGARARGTAADGAGRIPWTTEANALRLALTTYQAQIRKLADRERDIRKAAKGVPAESFAVIVRKVALDTGADVTDLARAAGRDLPEPSPPEGD